MEKIIEVKNLVKKYKNLVAVNDISFSVYKGEILGLLGPNGSGKTTLIKLACGLLKPTSGKIIIDGKEVGVETKSVVSYLPERNYIPLWMTVENIIDFFCDFYKDFRKELAYDMLKRLNINAKDKIKTMSKGTKEKVQLILVMSRKADLYVLDEPIGGVDPAGRDYILETILTNFNEGSSLLISTHLISDIENILDDVIFIKNGKIVLNENAENIREKTGKTIDNLFREEFKC